jgi:hypothetical protein
VRSIFDVVGELETTITALLPGKFLIIEYGVDRLDEPPYAQLAVDPEGYYLELVSERYLPARDWPIDEAALRSGHWLAPDSSTDNWWRFADRPYLAARSLLHALTVGRSCTSHDLFTVRTGSFPSPPGGGEPIPSWSQQAA